MFDIVEEPKEDMYRRLLDYASRYCSSFLLVLRQRGLDVGPSAVETLSKLEPFLLNKEMTNEWPGTRLRGHDAEVRRYELNSQSLELLKNVVSRLYQWQQPNFPEDLCLMLNEQKPWLVNIAHERASYLVIGTDEFDTIASEFPELASILQPFDDE